MGGFLKAALVGRSRRETIRRWSAAVMGLKPVLASARTCARQTGRVLLYENLALSWVSLGLTLGKERTDENQWELFGTINHLIAWSAILHPHSLQPCFLCSSHKLWSITTSSTLLHPAQFSLLIYRIFRSLLKQNQTTKSWIITFKTCILYPSPHPKKGTRTRHKDVPLNPKHSGEDLSDPLLYLQLTWDTSSIAWAWCVTPCLGIPLPWAWCPPFSPLGTDQLSWVPFLQRKLKTACQPSV